MPPDDPLPDFGFDTSEHYDPPMAQPAYGIDYQNKTSLRVSQATVEVGASMLHRLVEGALNLRDMNKLSKIAEEVLRRSEARGCESAQASPLPTVADAPPPETPTETVCREATDEEVAAAQREQAEAAQQAAVAEEDAKQAAHDEAVATGRGALTRLVMLWSQNFGVLDAPQPDRPSLLTACFTGYRHQTIYHIKVLGGLATACIDALLNGGAVTPEHANLLGRKIALNMVQVGSLCGVPLDRIMERSFYNPDIPVPEGWTDAQRDATLLATPLRGGIAAATINFDERPVPGENNDPSLFGDAGVPS